MQMNDKEPTMYHLLKGLKPGQGITASTEKPAAARPCRSASFQPAFLILYCSALLSLPAFGDDAYNMAEQLVKNQSCTAELNVDQFFEKKLTHTHRDLGWRVVAVEDGFSVERVFMVSKGAELRYRWHVANNATTPVASNERAQNLCGSDL
jgi:hypothetical protein